MSRTTVVATRITAEELERLDKALLGSLKGSYSNRSEFLHHVIVVALDGLLRSG